MAIRTACAALLLFVTAAATAQQAALFDELTLLYPDTDVATGSPALATATARGVPAGVHVLATGLPPGATVTWRLDRATATACRLHAVPVEQNTGLRSRTEAWDGKPNPHVVRRAPFSVFEALEPIGAQTKADDHGVLALRIEIPLAPDHATGPLAADLHLESGEWRSTLRWQLDVHAATVPPRTRAGRGFTNWFDPLAMAQRHDLEPWRDAHFAMIGRYADLMARSRQDTFWIRWPDFLRLHDGQLTVERERLQRYVRLFVERGFVRIESGHLARRHADDWLSSRLDLALTGTDVRTPAGQVELATLLGALRELLAALPPELELVQHLTDEPTDVNAATYRMLADQVRAALPGVRIFEATMSRALVGAVDCWCPQVQDYQTQADFFRERQAEGDDVWIYTCLSPGGPWLNRLLDQERLRPVCLGWALAKYDLRGFLHWGFNHYRSGVDPLQQSVVPHGKGPPNFLPGGDTHVVYPGPSGPWSGQRLEAHRIGMEDAALLDAVRARDPRGAQCILDQVLRSFDDYERDVAAYRRARHDLLVAASRTAPPPGGEPFLRVLTYNIHHGQGNDGAFDYDRLAAVIRAADPDLVALQEVDRGTKRAGGVDQAAVLGVKLGMHAAFGEAMPYDGGSYGEAVLSRFPLADVTTHVLGCAPGQEPRAALAVTVLPWGDGGPAVRFAGTHLCHQSGATRRRQVAEIQAALAGWQGPALLGGDFNFAPDSPPWRDLAASWVDSGRELGQERPTFGADRAPAERGPRIDFVWTRQGGPLLPRSVRVIEEPLASDHLPVLVIYRLAAEG